MAQVKESIQMVSLRDVRVVNTSGHCVLMKAGEPTRIPGALVETALSLGCVPADSTVYEDHKSKLERLERERKALVETLIAGVDTLVRRNQFEDFTPTGHPKIDVLAEICDVDPNSVTHELRDHAFVEWNTRNRTGRGKRSAAKPAVDSTPTPAAAPETPAE